jgi:hypothetical protein
MRTYKMTRVYVTYIEVEDGQELDDKIYAMELEQCNVVEERIELENEATHWVLTHGRDCDGGVRNQVMVFSNKLEADNTALEYSKWSDGLQYKVTDSFDEVKEYCLDYDLDFKNYM